METTHSHPVRVSADILEGLDAVWLLGETNTMDTREVQAQAYIMGYQLRRGGSNISQTSM